MRNKMKASISVIHIDKEGVETTELLRSKGLSKIKAYELSNIFKGEFTNSEELAKELRLILTIFNFSVGNKKEFERFDERATGFKISITENKGESELCLFDYTLKAEDIDWSKWDNEDESDETNYAKYFLENLIYHLYHELLGDTITVHSNIRTVVDGETVSRSTGSGSVKKDEEGSIIIEKFIDIYRVDMLISDLDKQIFADIERISKDRTNFLSTSESTGFEDVLIAQWKQNDRADKKDCIVISYTKKDAIILTTHPNDIHVAVLKKVKYEQLSHITKTKTELSIKPYKSLTFFERLYVFYNNILSGSGSTLLDIEINNKPYRQSTFITDNCFITNFAVEEDLEENLSLALCVKYTDKPYDKQTRILKL